MARPWRSVEPVIEAVEMKENEQQAIAKLIHDCNLVAWFIKIVAAEEPDDDMVPVNAAAMSELLEVSGEMMAGLVQRIEQYEATYLEMKDGRHLMPH